MKVSEAIKKLQEMPQDKELYLVDSEYELVEVLGIGTDTIRYQEVVTIRPYQSYNERVNQ